jgi:hypothetical protein
MVNCGSLSFERLYSHVKAHQDDKVAYEDLLRPAQLNVNMDYCAKQTLWDIPPTRPPTQQAFRLEPVCIFANAVKITADSGHETRYLAHRCLARNHFYQLGILDPDVFNYVDWEMVHGTLHEVLRLFQQWACKQVMGIAGTMEWDKTTVRKCPICLQARNTCAHVLHCDHSGRVETLRHTIDLIEAWMEEVDIEPDLLDCIAEYAWARGGRTMEDICTGLGDDFQRMARDQDAIG